MLLLTARHSHQFRLDYLDTSKITLPIRKMITQLFLHVTILHLRRNILQNVR